MCRALRESGTTTLIAATDADGSGRLPVKTGEVQTHEGVPVIFFRRLASESFKWSVELAQWLRAHVADFDLVHVHAVFSHSSLAAGRACRARRIPYLVRPLGTLDPWSLGRHRMRKAILFRLGVNRLLAGADAIHYTSDEEQRLVEQQLSWLPPGAVVPLGVDDDLFAPNGRLIPVNEGRRLLVLSRLDVKKGIDLVIKAFHMLAADERSRGWTLVIAGDGDPAYVAHLQTLAQSGEARGRITFRGWVSGDERMALLRSASLFVLPSHQENFGIAIIEAMACNTPVVVSDGVNLAADIAKASAGWITERESGALRETLGAAMADRAELQRRGRSARQLAERYRWPHVCGRLLALYDEAVARRAGSGRQGEALVAAQYSPSGRAVKN
jgi:glycosyltransferase involved in cell wall biosynthesis